MGKKVLVCGVFDLLHSGHIAFFKEASKNATEELIVAVYNDNDTVKLNGKKPIIEESERAFMCSHVRYVSKSIVITSPSLEALLDEIKPDVFFLNADDDTPEKQRACKSKNVRYMVGKRVPLPGIAPRSSTAIRAMLQDKKDGNDSGVQSSSVVLEGCEDVKSKLIAPRPAGSKPVVMVSGCFDLLHSGHVRFFEEASELNGGSSLYVSIGSDKNILLLKKHEPMFPENERRIMVQSMRSVEEAHICSGSGYNDFEADLDIIKPELFFVNADGHREGKQVACQKRGISYIVGERKPAEGLEARSSTTLKETLALSSSMTPGKSDDLTAFPWRVCLAGGWLDQPWVSEVCSGSVIVVNIFPHEAFKTRSGLATSTRQVGIKLWSTNSGGSPPSDVPHLELAYMLFGAENPPGCKYVAGSQDALGLMLPGISRLDYEGEYWPSNVTTIKDEATVKWLEDVLYLVPLPSRPEEYDPLITKNITKENVSLLRDASALAWKSIEGKDAKGLGKALSDTLEAWRLLLPNTVPQAALDSCKPYCEGSYGCLFTGCGGGFLMVVSDKPVKDSFKVRVKTRHWF